MPRKPKCFAQTTRDSRLEFRYAIARAAPILPYLHGILGKVRRVGRAASGLLLSGVAALSAG
ncbi:hypothetical protein RGCCGE502_05874 [Rhizobium grahamii CCGE 502]|uniref:Uncharacterized protein n=1 Tax=Rhizobium grahamii CCGE 502 TaxID=990285 RepID=S3HLK9_9HYPH|nr:hypothetical protein RGCCGE502_05874 [Rhizobium grahamii CCGE 502]